MCNKNKIQIAYSNSDFQMCCLVAFSCFSFFSKKWTDNRTSLSVFIFLINAVCHSYYRISMNSYDFDTLCIWLILKHLLIDFRCRYSMLLPVSIICEFVAFLFWFCFIPFSDAFKIRSIVYFVQSIYCVHVNVRWWINIECILFL